MDPCAGIFVGSVESHEDSSDSIKIELSFIWDSLDALPVDVSTDRCRERATNLEEAVSRWEVQPPSALERSAVAGAVRVLEGDVSRANRGSE